MDPSARKDAEALEKDVQDTIASLEGFPVVTIDMLAEAWPREYRPTRLKSSSVGAEDEKKESPKHIANLVDISILPAIRPIVFNGEDSAGLDQILLQPGRLSSVKESFTNLFKDADVPAQGMPLLTSIISAEAKLSPDDNSLDLSCHRLGVDQILHVVSSVKPGIESLDISHNLRIDISALERISTDLPTIRRLNLLDCGSLNAAELKALMDSCPTLFMNLSYLIHEIFLVFDVPVHLYPKRTFSIGSRIPYSGEFATTIPAPSLNRVVLAFMDLVEPFADPTRGWVPDSPLQNPLAVSAALSRDDTIIIVDGKETVRKWNERSVVVIPRYSRRATEGWLLLFAKASMFEGGAYAFIDLSGDNSSNAAQPPQTTGSEQPEPEAKGSTDAVQGSDRQQPKSYRVYDFQGFLACCMEKNPERVPAKEENVKKLDGVLKSMVERHLLRLLSDAEVAAVYG